MQPASQSEKGMLLYTSGQQYVDLTDGLQFNLTPNQSSDMRVLTMANDWIMPNEAYLPKPPQDILDALLQEGQGDDKGGVIHIDNDGTITRQQLSNLQSDILSVFSGNATSPYMRVPESISFSRRFGAAFEAGNSSNPIIGDISTENCTLEFTDGRDQSLWETNSNAGVFTFTFSLADDQQLEIKSGPTLLIVYDRIESDTAWYNILARFNFGLTSQIGDIQIYGDFSNTEGLEGKSDGTINFIYYGIMNDTSVTNWQVMVQQVTRYDQWNYMYHNLEVTLISLNYDPTIS